jgi:hypothetical protein
VEKGSLRKGRGGGVLDKFKRGLGRKGLELWGTIGILQQRAIRF